jgi:hypothetical protein
MEFVKVQYNHRKGRVSSQKGTEGIKIRDFNGHLQKNQHIEDSSKCFSGVQKIFMLPL